MGMLWPAVMFVVAEYAAGMVKIPSGEFVPLYRPDNKTTSVRVESFLLDRVPVTNGEFLRFVTDHPLWRRSQAPAIFRDPHYLSGWTSDGVVPSGVEGRPVTFVSWFAARAYCGARAKRLPTTAEWEYAARGAPDEALGWYATAHDGPLPEAGDGPPSALGLYDFHRLWEWVEDFNSSLLRGDNRSDADNDRNLFCGAAAAESIDRADYAAFMRYAFRSSLKASYSTHNLGFRCARGVPEGGLE